MPDLETQSRCVCESVFNWSTLVESSSGDGHYTVAWQETPEGEEEYGWTCTCPHHMYRGAECKHIKSVKDERCGWGEEAFAGGGTSEHHEECPRCGGPTRMIKVGV